MASGASAGGSRGARSQARLGTALQLKGDITGSEDLIIDGEVEGTVELKENDVTVGPKGNVRAHVKARTITILGHLKGNVQAGHKVEIRKTGSLEGDLVTPRIVIEDGAVFRGSIDILQPGGGQRALAGKSVPASVASQPKNAPAAVEANVTAPKSSPGTAPKTL